MLDVGNDQADYLAKQGADPESACAARITERAYSVADWGAQRWLDQLEVLTPVCFMSTTHLARELEGVVLALLVVSDRSMQAVIFGVHQRTSQSTLLPHAFLQCRMLNGRHHIQQIV